MYGITESIIAKERERRHLRAEQDAEAEYDPRHELKNSG